MKAEIQKVLAVRGANANYVGEYKDDKMHGQGTYSSSNPFIPFLSSLEVWLQSVTLGSNKGEKIDENR